MSAEYWRTVAEFAIAFAGILAVGGFGVGVGVAFQESVRWGVALCLTCLIVGVLAFPYLAVYGGAS